MTDKKDGLWVEYHLRGDAGFTGAVLDRVTFSLKQDPAMETDREAALKSDRNVVCKK